MPAISVIIPVYNAAEYLHKCLDSIINQTFTDLEIICVNDCSKDNSLEILREYEEKDVRIKVVDCERNNRQAVARNIGMKMATGKYIAFVDADDWIDRDRFYRLFETAEREKTDAVLSGCVYEYENGCVKYTIALAVQKRLISGIKMTNEVILENVNAGGPCHGIYRATLLKDNNLEFQSIRSEDYVFNIEAYARAKVICLLPNCDYHVRALELSDSRGAIMLDSLGTISRMEACVDYLQNNNYLRKIISNYQRFVNKKTISEFCVIVVRTCSITSTMSFFEKCVALSSIMKNATLQKSLRDVAAFRMLRKKQRLLVKLLQYHFYPLIVLGLILREFSKREYYRIKNSVYKVLYN